MEQNYVIFVDTDMDFTPEICKKYDFKLISMPYSFSDKETVYPYVDFEEFQAHEFFERLRKGEMPTTSALNPADYEKYFEPYFKAGTPILYVHFSRAMSGTFNAMNIALKSMKEKYPNLEFYEVDTKAITIGSFNIACEIGDMYSEGKSIKEILSWAETEVDKFATYFFVDNLSFFRRSGRVKTMTAIMGNMLGIRPVMHMSSGGELMAIDKARGLNGAVDKVVDYVVKLQDKIKDHRIVVGHSDNLKNVELVIAKLKEKLGEDLNIITYALNPTIGAHCGPDAIGVCFHAIHR